MSLFPAYAPSGSSKASSSKDGDSGGRDLYIIDRDGGGSSANPILIDDNEEEGEIKTPNDSPKIRAKDNRDKQRHKKHKRKRSRSKSRSQSPRNKRKKKKRSKSPSPRRDRYEDRGNYHRQDYNSDRRQGQRGDSYQYQQRDRYDEGRRGEHRFDGGRNYQERDKNYQSRDKARDKYYEDQRLNVAQRFPKKVFLEEVNLQPEFAFRIDTEANYRQLKFYTMSNTQKSIYQNMGAKVVGASDQELVHIYSKFSKFRCIYPQEVDEEQLANSNPISSSRPVPKDKTRTFIGFTDPEKKRSKKRGNNKDSEDGDGRIDMYHNPNAMLRKEPELKEQVESFNKKVRENPRNVTLWKEFIEFQDKYYAETDQASSEDGPSGGTKKKRRNQRALLEKKVSITEKALESNPKNLELHFMRLNFLDMLHQPDFVLSEWKKMVTGNQQVTAFWMEYFRYASSQLQVYSTTRVTQVIQKSFSQFRNMLSPKYPDFQRPEKFLLVINDVLFALSLVLRNAGYTEKAIALHQGQLEADFYLPTDQIKSDSLLEWTKNKKLFEFFWDIGTLKFGESENVPGWSNCVNDVEKYSSQKCVIGAVGDSKASAFEDSFFETMNANNCNIDKSRHWLLIESYRSKWQWLCWRPKCSDVEEIDDSNRVVLGQDISPCIVPIPNLPYISEFDRQSAHFRHLVNFVLTIQEDFIPQTETLSSVLNPFTSISLTESKSIVSELFYWKKLLNLYVPDEKEIQVKKDAASSAEQKSLLKTPEGFRVENWTLPISSAFKCDIGRKPTSLDLENYYQDNEKLEKVITDRKELLETNESTYKSMLYNVIDKGIDALSSPFSSLLFEMYLRFEQKNTVGSKESRKVRIKSAKKLMQKESLRNSMGCYLEMGMFEYFEGNKSNCINLLVKTLNLGCSTLLENDEQTTGYIDIEKNWETATELVKIYTRLAEFHLTEKPQLAYHILCLLGCGFKPVNLEVEEETLNANRSNAVLLKALRHFEKVFTLLVPGVEDDIELSEKEEKTVFKLSKEILERWDGGKCVNFIVQKSNIIVEWTKAFALFQFLSKDFTAASQVYEKVLERIETPQPLSHSGNYEDDIVIRHFIREQLYISWCNLGAHVLTKNPMTNSKFRNILGQALEQFPSSPPLLLLFTEVEDQMSIAGKLWRLMARVVKQDGACNHWTPLLMGIGLAKKIEDLERDEEIGLTCFGLGGPAVPPDTIFYKLDSLLTAAQENRLSRNCPLVWRVHLKLLALRTLQGKDVQRAKSTFYEAVRHCPSSKALYLDGISYFPDMLKEITDLMGEKQLYTRLPVEELDVLLEIEDVSRGKRKKEDSYVEVSSDDD